MSYVDAVAVLAISAGVVTLLAFADPGDALGYLLAFPIWIVTKDFGVIAGAGAGACALLVLLIVGADLGPIGYLGYTALFLGTVAVGARPSRTGPAQRASPLPSLLTVRPDITRKLEALSRRELQVLEMLATGAKNAQIAERFVISQNTVKSHVSRILQKLPAGNRTEAAFRYIEIYGVPPSSAAADGALDQPDRLTAASAMRATVSGLPRGDGLILTLQDGRDLDVPVLDEIRPHVRAGAAAIVYFDQQDRVIGWYLPDEEIGVDLRRWAAP